MTDYNITDHDRELETHLSKERETIINDYQKNFLLQEKGLEHIIIGLEHSQHNNFKDNKLIWNIAGNVSIIAYDLKIIICDLTFAKGEWQKRHYARQASLIIYESVEDLFILLGKDFVDLTNNRLDITNLKEDLKAIRADLNTFRTIYSEDLKNIRNLVTAHRDKEVLKQVHIIKQINWGQSLQMALQFNGILVKLGQFLDALIKKGLKELSELDPYRKTT